MTARVSSMLLHLRCICTPRAVRVVLCVATQGLVFPASVRTVARSFPSPPPVSAPITAFGGGLSSVFGTAAASASTSVFGGAAPLSGTGGAVNPFTGGAAVNPFAPAGGMAPSNPFTAATGGALSSPFTMLGTAAPSSFQQPGASAVSVGAVCRRVCVHVRALCVYAVLCCAVLCCAVLCCAVLCCAVLCCAVLCCGGVGCMSFRNLATRLWLCRCCSPVNVVHGCDCPGSCWR
jgi:hypothetical protein